MLCFSWLKGEELNGQGVRPSVSSLISPIHIRNQGILDQASMVNVVGAIQYLIFCGCLLMAHEASACCALGTISIYLRI